MSELLCDGISFVSRAEMSEARAAVVAASPDFTMGYELEVLPVAQPLLPALDVQIRHEGKSLSAAQKHCIELLGEAGFDAHKQGGPLYEVISPVANHWKPLALATTGLVRAGLLPRQAPGLSVVAHLSYGSPKQVQDKSDEHYGTIRMTRMIEMLGGSSPERIANGIRGDNEDLCHWNCRGLGGVATRIRGDTKWEGNCSRQEARTFIYKDEVQFSDTLRLWYYLARAKSSDEQARDIYEGLDELFRAYQEAYGMRDASEYEAIPIGKTSTHFLSVEDMEDYMAPFLKHMQEGDTSELKQVVECSISKLQSVFDESESLREAA